MPDLKTEAKKELARRELARRNLLWFAKYTFDGFESSPFHENYYKILDAFAKQQIKNLIVAVPPQHGKSVGSSRMLPAFLFGRNPKLKIAIASYNTTYARKFNRELQRTIDSQEYRNIFPDTRLNSSNITTVSRGWLRNSEEFEIVGYTGSLKAVGRGGPLTGSPVDVMIMDDLYKDYAEANSPVIRAGVIDWYKTVPAARLHNKSQQLIVFTRWHDEDLIGWLESRQEVRVITSLDDFEPGFRGWHKVNFEAIKESEQTDIDQRENGEALWPNRHSIERLNEMRDQDSEKFQGLYQGNPRPSEGLLYSGFNTYEKLPENINGIKNYTDTADSGKDNLCSINYVVGQDRYIYITDILYTSESMEKTEPKTADLLISGGVSQADIEANAGGRGFARAVQRIMNERGKHIHVNQFHQSLNKESRILTNAATVQQRILFPENWTAKWPVFAKDLLHFKRLFGANTHDDAPDALTGVWEKSGLATGSGKRLDFVIG